MSFEINYIHETWYSLMELAFLIGMCFDYPEAFIWEPEEEDEEL